MIDLVDIAITSGGIPSLPLPTLLSPALAMMRLDCGPMEDMTCTFLGDVALEDAVEELGMAEEVIRLFKETPPHLGLLGTGFLEKTSNDIIAGNGSYMVLAMSEEPNNGHLNNRNI